MPQSLSVSVLSPSEGVCPVQVGWSCVSLASLSREAGGFAHLRRRGLLARVANSDGGECAMSPPFSSTLPPLPPPEPRPGAGRATPRALPRPDSPGSC